MTIRLSTHGRYGVRAMLDLAERFGEGPVLVRSIAERQAISAKYLHAILTSLRAAKLVRSVRGSGGGYALARAPEEIFLNQVVEALEGPICLVECVSDESVCDRASHCAARDVWSELSVAMETMLSSITLGELVERQRTKRETADPANRRTEVARGGPGSSKRRGKFSAVV
jgi:Rrf2 family protein